MHYLITSTGKIFKYDDLNHAQKSLFKIKNAVLVEDTRGGWLVHLAPDNLVKVTTVEEAGELIRALTVAKP